ncbi:hypothetical protein DNI29_04200 [Hymenobacter sediminis]|uniref:hypothetical protein n=1 Tax=Hymenobacter sediminis TaxID=2218621 RepID=UPI000DA693DD|nr:hypothetical protein [Hymenobacter sediminis]RPD50005.1 hypothetical protein DNI29_04200 [Hymenobacter sediminis]
MSGPDSGRLLPGDTIGGRQAEEYPAEEAGDLRISLNAFTFFKDNEYFNSIVEGYTLFGTQLNPQLVYYPTANLRLEGGVFLWKDFGTARLRQVRPTFRATYAKGAHTIVLGNIQPHLYHGYIEPLFNFERVISRPLEEGLQYRYNSGRVGLDVWVDWQRQQYRYSNYQEEIAGGLSGSVRLTGNNSPVTLFLPLQFTATHRGGQIDTINRPLQTLFNGATGLEARYQLPNKRTALRLQAYGVGFYDKSFTYELPYKRGAALYLNGTVETRLLDVMLSYWQGQRYLSPLGGDLYQSASRSVTSPDYRQPNRQLLFVRLMRDFSLGEAAAITVRVEPVHDFKENITDFSFGVYLNFRQEWLLGNVGQRMRFR